MEEDRPRVDFQRAPAAMHRLQANPGDAGAVHEIVRSLSGKHGLRLLERVRKDARGA